MAEFLADRPQVPAVVAQQKQKLYVAVLLDRSGSMAARKEETIGAFNGYVAGLEKDDAVDARLTLTQFDST
ncbi:MAG TPA: hypothetical protein VEI97_10205, partial [bacterium]|nr:hypothetical protein [bacterium]